MWRPLFHGAIVGKKVIGLQDRNTSRLHKIWVALVGAVAFVFKNQSEDQFATKIPIEGTFTDPQPNIFYAVWQVLQNAFIQALTPSIDNEINLSSIKGDKANSDNPKGQKPDSNRKKRNKN